MNHLFLSLFAYLNLQGYLKYEFRQPKNIDKIAGSSRLSGKTIILNYVLALKSN